MSWMTLKVCNPGNILLLFLVMSQTNVRMMTVTMGVRWRCGVRTSELDTLSLFIIEEHRACDWCTIVWWSWRVHVGGPFHSRKMGRLPAVSWCTAWREPWLEPRSGLCLFCTWWHLVFGWSSTQVDTKMIGVGYRCHFLEMEHGRVLDHRGPGMKVEVELLDFMA
jgi:hypothetical protein